jgi:hypothetical protein
MRRAGSKARLQLLSSQEVKEIEQEGLVDNSEDDDFNKNINNINFKRGPATATTSVASQEETALPPPTTIGLTTTTTTSFPSSSASLLSPNTINNMRKSGSLMDIRTLSSRAQSQLQHQQHQHSTTTCFAQSLSTSTPSSLSSTSHVVDAIATTTTTTTVATTAPTTAPTTATATTTATTAPTTTATKDVSPVDVFAAAMAHRGITVNIASHPQRSTFHANDVEKQQQRANKEKISSKAPAIATKNKVRFLFFICLL